MTGAERIARERAKQVEKWSSAHDAEHRKGELVEAALAFLDPDERTRVAFLLVTERGVSARYPESWSGLRAGWGKRDQVERLTVAGALIAAEIDRLQRERGYEEVQQGR